MFLFFPFFSEKNYGLHIRGNNNHYHKMQLKHPSIASIVYHTLNPKHEIQKRRGKNNITRRDLKKSWFRLKIQEKSHQNRKKLQQCPRSEGWEDEGTFSREFHALTNQIPNKKVIQIISLNKARLTYHFITKSLPVGIAKKRWYKESPKKKKQSQYQIEIQTLNHDPECFRLRASLEGQPGSPHSLGTLNTTLKPNHREIQRLAEATTANSERMQTRE